MGQSLVTGQAGIMKRRAKLSLRRNSQKLKKPHVIEYTPGTQGYLNKASHNVGGFVASLLTPSCQQTAEMRIDSSGDITETSGPESTPLDHPNVCENTATHDCDVGSQEHPTDPMAMSCESASVGDVSPGSGHQMESERDVEEYGDTDDTIPSSSVSCNSKVESDLEEVDFITDPTHEIDLYTHCCDDHSNPALYSLTSDDVAQFEDFGTPHRDRTQSNPSIKRQTSLLSFMSRTSRSNSESPLTLSTNKQQTASTSLADSVMPTGKGKATNRVNGQADTGSQVSEENGTSGRTKRTCPFYKRIPGTLYINDTVLVL